MPQIPGTVISAKVTTGDTANTFPIGDQNEIQGGHHSVQSISERDAITVERRKEGMTCFVIDTQQTFQLMGGTANGNWVDQATATAQQLYQTTVLAWAGTATADTALSVAGQGTNLAYTALQQAWYGTQAAAQIGYPALVTAWVGTATANAALRAAGAGTVLATQALAVASTGTDAAAAAIALANQAKLTAQTGTIPPFLDELQDVNAPAPSVSQVLAWNGSQWVAADTPSQVAPGAYTLFLDDAPSGTAGYSSLLPVPSGTPEVQDIVVVGGAVPIALNDNFLAITPLNTSVISAGVWEFNNFVSVNNPSNPTEVVVDIYTRSSVGAEALLFSGTSSAITSLTPTPQLVTTIITQGSFNVAPSDKLLARYWFAHAGTDTVSAVCYHGGTAHDSHFHTPIGFTHNDLQGLQGGQTAEYYHVTKNQNDALAGTDGIPSAADKFVTDTDSRLATGTQGYYIATAGTSQAQDAYNLAELAYNLASQNPATPSAGNWLLAGGQVIWVSGYTFQVGPTTVSFAGTAVNFAGTTLALQPSDLTNNRIDIIVADQSHGTIGAITGIASTPAVPPDYDPVHQFELTFIPVDANTSQPAGAETYWIYRENTEWTAVTVSSGINVNSSTDPYSGSKCIEATNALTNATVRYQAGTDFELNNYQTLFMYVKPKTAWGNNFLRIDFENNAGRMFGRYVVLQNGFLGFNASNLNYQLVAIPISLFAVPVGSAVRIIRINCQNFSGPQNWRIDDIGLQLGVSQVSQPVVDATTTQKGIVQLEQNGGTIPGRAVTGDDYRLALAVSGTSLAYNALQQAWYGTQAAAQIGYPALVTAWVGTATANVALSVAGTGTNTANTAITNITNEATTRGNADLNLQNQINAINAALGISFQGTFSLYMANFRNGPPDNKVSVINGVVTGLTPSYYVWEDFESYAIGTLPPLTAGSAWAGAGTITSNVGLGILAEDQMFYGTGTVVPSGPIVLNQGTGWSSYGTAVQSYIGLQGTDLFETYVQGTTTGSNVTYGTYFGSGFIDGGIGWSGTATIYAY